MTLDRSRRVACATLAPLVAAVLLHAQIAAALVTRGDDAERSGDAAAALRAYRRALLFDASSTTAADRLAFFLALRHDDADARAAVAVATTALRTADDPALRADRAFAEMQLHAWSRAAADFAAAGERARDARYDHLAGRMALRAGDRASARVYAARALGLDPRFSPARALLRSVE
jgi:Tfp pilus assembly protein PilF